MGKSRQTYCSAFLADLRTLSALGLSVNAKWYVRLCRQCLDKRTHHVGKVFKDQQPRKQLLFLIGAGSDLRNHVGCCEQGVGESDCRHCCIIFRSSSFYLKDKIAIALQYRLFRQDECRILNGGSCRSCKGEELFESFS